MKNYGRISSSLKSSLMEGKLGRGSCVGESGVWSVGKYLQRGIQLASSVNKTRGVILMADPLHQFYFLFLFSLTCEEFIRIVS